MSKIILILILLTVLCSAEQLPLFDFTGGTNTTDFPTNLAENEALLIQNLVFKNNVLIGRKGYALYNATSLGNLRPKGIHRAGNKKLYLAYNGFLWKNKDAGDTSFVKVDSLADTLASANYVSFLDYNDTTWLVDGRNFWKTTGDSLIRGNICWEGKVTRMMSPPVASEDTIFLKQDSRITNNVVSSDNPTRIYENADESYIGVTLGDTLRALFHVDLSGFQVGDIITSATCSLVVNRQRSATAETLGIKRCSTVWFDNVNWNSQPLVTGSNIGTAIVAATGWFTIDLTTWVDSVVNSGLVNRGIRLHLLDETNNNNAKSVILRGLQTNRIRITVLAVRKTSIIESHPNIVIDTTVGGLWSTNRWQEFYVEFAGDSASVNGDYVRLIDSTKYDSIFLNTPLISPNWVVTRNETYRIIAYPTSRDDIFTGKVESVTTISAVDSTRKIWIGNQTIVPSTYNNGRYFFKIKSGRGQGIYQILYGNTTSSQDWFAVFSSRGDIVDSTTRFTVFQAIWPPCDLITIIGNRGIFAGDSLHPGWYWWAEPKVLGEVGGLNFKPIGGEPAEGEITAIRPLFASNYAEPQNPLMIYKSQSVNADFIGLDPETSVPIKVLDKFGTVSNRSVVLVEGNQYFQSIDKNFYLTNGKDIKLLSNKIKSTVDSIADSTLYKTAGFYYDRNVYWSIKQNTGSAYKTLAYNIDNGTWTEHTFRFGQATYLNPATDTLAPICFTNPDTGKAYKFGKATEDLGVAVTAAVNTRWFDMGKPDWEKKIISIRGLTKSVAEWIGMWAVLNKDNSGVITDNPVDSVQFTTIGTTNLLKYFNNRPVGKNFQVKFKTYAANFNLGGGLLEFILLKKEGY